MGKRKRPVRLYNRNQKERSEKVINKKIVNAQALEVNGIRFKSKLELFTFNELKKAGIEDFKYEEDKFVLQEPFVFPNSSVELYTYTHTDEKGNKSKRSAFGDVTSNIRAITYTPDFVMIRPDKTGYIIETKGFKTNEFTIKWKMFKRHLVENGYQLSLYAPNNQQNVLRCIQSIKARYYL
jgi:hypothetical protein